MKNNNKIRDANTSQLLKYQGSLLREIRKSTPYTMDDIAREFNKTKSWISEIENGRNNISYIDLIKLINLYNADINELSKEIQIKMDELNDKNNQK